MIIATVVPNDYFAPWDYVYSIFKLPPKYRFRTVQSCYVDYNRNFIFREIKEEDEDLLFIDSDIAFEPEDVFTIENNLRNCDIVTGLYRLLNGNLAIFKRINGDYEYTESQTGIFEIGACGAGFLGISKKVIKKMPLNPFSPFQEGNITHGDDVSFCHRAKMQGFKIWCDSSIKVGHIKTKILKA